MKKIIIIIFFFTKLVYAETTIIKIASVNEKLITNIDLQEEIIINKILYGKNIQNIESLSLNNLIDQIIKEIEIKQNNIIIEKKIIDDEYQKFIISKKINNEVTNKMKDQIYQKIKTEIEWNNLITKLYGWRTNINLSEINEILSSNKDTENNIANLNKEKLIEIEKIKKFKVYSLNHLDEKKKMALIKFYR